MGQRKVGASAVVAAAETDHLLIGALHKVDSTFILEGAAENQRGATAAEDTLQTSVQVPDPDPDSRY